MKKSLLALSVFGAFAGLAHADDTSVTLYGNIDIGVATTSNVLATAKTTTAPAVAGTLTTVQSGGLSTSKWGLRGTEDMGDGFKAKFNVESELIPQSGETAASDTSGAATANTTTGAVTTTGSTAYSQLFKRGAWAGLSQDGVGEVRLGRQNTANYDYGIKYDAFKGGNVGGILDYTDSNSTTYLNTYGVDRYDFALQLRSANFSGFNVRLGHAFGGVAGSNNAGAVTDVGAEFETGPLSVAVAYLNKNNNVQATNTTPADTSSALTNIQGFVMYNFGVVVVNAGYTDTKRKVGTPAEQGSYKAALLGARFPITPQSTIIAQYARMKNDAADQKPKEFSLGYQYDTSKRTSLYVLAAFASQDGTSRLNTASTSKFTNVNGSSTIQAGAAPIEGDNQHTLMIGLNHKF